MPTTDERVTLAPMPGRDGELLLTLPEFTYLDTQAWSVEVGIPAACLPQLVEAAQGAAGLRVRNALLRQTHEAVRTRFGILLPVCGTQIRNAVEAPAGSEVTCLFCNGTEKPIGEQQ